MIGIIVSIRKKRNKYKYGFIEAYDGERYYFRLEDENLMVGMEVKFKGERNEKGGYASKVNALAT